MSDAAKNKGNIFCHCAFLANSYFIFQIFNAKAFKMFTWFLAASDVSTNSATYLAALV
jgi:hypothetical protein